MIYDNAWPEWDEREETWPRYPRPEREQVATIDRNFAVDPDIVSLPFDVDRIKFYRWLAFHGGIRG